MLKGDAEFVLPPYLSTLHVIESVRLTKASLTQTVSVVEEIFVIFNNSRPKCDSQKY